MKKESSYKECYIKVKRLLQNPWLYKYKIDKATLDMAGTYVSLWAQQPVDYTRLCREEGIEIEK